VTGPLIPIKQAVTDYTVDFVVAALPGWLAVFQPTDGGTTFLDVAAWAVVAATPPASGHKVVPLVIGGSGLTVASNYDGYTGIAPPGAGNNWAALPDLAPAPV